MRYHPKRYLRLSQILRQRILATGILLANLLAEQSTLRGQECGREVAAVRSAIQKQRYEAE